MSITKTLNEHYINFEESRLEATERAIREMDLSGLEFDPSLFLTALEGESSSKLCDISSDSERRSNSSFEINLEKHKRHLKGSSAGNNLERNFDHEIESQPSQTISQQFSPCYPAEEGNFNKFFPSTMLELNRNFASIETNDFDLEGFNLAFQANMDELEKTDKMSIDSAEFEKEMFPFLNETNYDRSEMEEPLKIPSFSFQPKLDDITYMSESQIEANFLALAKKQKTCLQLQGLCEENPVFVLERLFPLVLGNLADLISDNYGNFLVAKMLSMVDSVGIFKVLSAMNYSFPSLAASGNGSAIIQNLILRLDTKKNLEMFTTMLLSSLPYTAKSPHMMGILKQFISCINYPYNTPVYKYLTNNITQIVQIKKGGHLLEEALMLANNKQMNEFIQALLENLSTVAKAEHSIGLFKILVGPKIRRVDVKIAQYLTFDLENYADNHFSSRVLSLCLDANNPEVKGIIVENVAKESFILKGLSKISTIGLILRAYSVAEEPFKTRMTNVIC